MATAITRGNAFNFIHYIHAINYFTKHGIAPTLRVFARVGDDDPAPLSREVIAALKVLTDNGTGLYLMQGNRDFLIDKRFARETGCTLLPDYYVAQLEGHNLLLLHGDTLCTGDEQYQRFRRKARHPVFRWCLNHLPLRTRQNIAKNWRAKSMNANSNKPDNIMDVTASEVERQMEKYQVNTMIHGHTHRPNRHQHKQGERLVLGDWHHHGWYIRVTERTEPELISFPIKD
ncbi:MAG TPA: UDP-2,3-diacylglucosamine diphosphatase [Porticoccus sp.]|nr:UDP-2,3-diacylglucosamine diphosphatase [Porticoccus sp.]